MRLLILLVFIIACNSPDNTGENLIESAGLNENEIGLPIITITKEGVPLVKASSNTLIKNKSSNAILRGNVNADFFDEKGIHISNLTSDSAYIDQRTNNLRAYGNVVVANNDSLKLFSNSILWDNHYELITSRDSVMFIKSKNDTVYGLGFESDMDLTEYKIIKPRGVTRRLKNK